jgi:hypothetical protein
MLRSVKKLEGLAMGATDGPIGKVTDLYFDDEAWVIRYVVVDTSSWLGGRKVLISPYSMKQPDWTGETLPVSVTKDQVRNSPGIDSHKPISRQYEESYLKYYGYPLYWGGEGLWGTSNYPGTLPMGMIAEPQRVHDGYLRPPSKGGTGADPHLRSCQTVTGYHIRARDGEIGHVQGFLVDDSSWSLRYLIVNTSNWWIGHQVLVSPEWIKDVDWAESVVTIDLDRQSIKESPTYDADAPLAREAEGALYTHYNRDNYWLDPKSRAAA